MRRPLADVATYPALGFVVLVALEYGDLVSPSPSQYLPLQEVYVVTLIVALLSWWRYLDGGPPGTRPRRRRRLGVWFLLGLVLALAVSVLSIGKLVFVPPTLLIYVYGTVGAVGVLLAIPAGRQVTLDEFGAGRPPAPLHDRPFFVAVGLFAAALLAFHAAGLDAQLLGVVLFFASLLYYTHEALFSDA